MSRVAITGREAVVRVSEIGQLQTGECIEESEEGTFAATWHDEDRTVVDGAADFQSGVKALHLALLKSMTLDQFFLAYFVWTWPRNFVSSCGT